MGPLIERAWSDESFKQALRADPKPILEKYGIIVPDHVSVVVLENSANTLHFVLPSPPFTDSVMDEDLEITIVGTGNNSCFPTYCCTEDC